ncbi:MAG: archaellin/type IV pilin N-terminal domain-containing protein [Nitrososphaerales archaeon]
MQRTKLICSIRSRRAISPIIATLLLILIAIASGVIIYVYVIGFVSNSTLNSGISQSTISIDNSCVSTATHCSGSQYSITIRNIGTNTISNVGPPTAQIYFTDVASSTTGTATCTISSQIAPGGTLTCSGSNPASLNPSSGDSVSIKVVMPDGGAAVATTRVLS